MFPLFGAPRWRRWSAWRMRRTLLALLRRSPQSWRPPAQISGGGKNPFAEIDAIYFWVWGHLQDARQRALLLEVVALSGRGLAALSDYFGEDLLPRLQEAEQARTVPTRPLSTYLHHFQD